jgi:predicted nucleotidyltransferase
MRELEEAMTREEMVRLLKSHKATLAERFGVTDLALFGSMARGEAQQGSDLDVLAAFDGPATSRRYFGAQFYLEDLLGAPVDLVTEKALRSELRLYVYRDAISRPVARDEYSARILAIDAAWTAAQPSGVALVQRRRGAYEKRVFGIDLRNCPAKVGRVATPPISPTPHAFSPDGIRRS